LKLINEKIKMDRLQAIKLCFALAVLLFVAKPFLGFSACEANQPIGTYSLLTKSFSKRKPKDFEISEAQRQLAQAPALKLLSIVLLLDFLFPFIYKRLSVISSQSLNGLNVALVPVQPSYLLTGKLII
jgi:hypothetical protein